MAAEKTLFTADDLLRLPDGGKQHELVRGELRKMSPGGWEQGIVSARLVRRVANHVEDHDLGLVLTNEPGFRIERDPQTVRATDLAFVAKDRVPASRPSVAFPDFAPDLVAEVVSPSESAADVEEKIHLWLRAGVRLLWVLYPRLRSISVYRSFEDVRILDENSVLDGADVLPGFSCPVRDLFPY